MIFAKLLQMRGKLTAKRKKMAFDDEKPFLDHLEDLRNTIMKMVITLTVAMTVGFAFYKEFYKIVIYPAKLAGVGLSAEPNRPVALSQDDWEEVKRLTRTALELSGDTQRAYLETAAKAKPEMRWVVEAMIIYRAAKNICPQEPEDKSDQAIAARALRDEFLAKSSANSPELKKALDDLVLKNPKVSLEPSKSAIDFVWRKPAEGFTLAVKLSLYGGILASFPLLFYFLMQFILPGLTGKEKSVVWPALGVGTGLFFSGVVFAYLVVIPRVLSFFYDWSAQMSDDVASVNLWGQSEYMSFVLQFCVIFGISFELPVVVISLVWLGLLESAFMRRTRAWAVLIIVVVGALITPTGDLLTLSLLAGPMVVMYECCIWIAWWMEKKRAKREEAERQENARRIAKVQLDREQAMASQPAETEVAAAPAPTPPALLPEHSENAVHGESTDHSESTEREVHEDHDPFHHDYKDEHHDHHHSEEEEEYRREHPDMFVQPGEDPGYELPTSSEAPPEAPAAPEPPTEGGAEPKNSD